MSFIVFFYKYLEEPDLLVDTSQVNKADDVDWKQKYNDVKAGGKSKDNDNDYEGEAELNTSEDDLKKVPKRPQDVKLDFGFVNDQDESGDDEAVPTNEPTKKKASKFKANGGKTPPPPVKQQKGDPVKSGFTKGSPKIPPTVKPNNIPKPVVPEEPEDPKNPKGFLGGIEEVGKEQVEMNGNIFTEEDDEEVLQNMKSNKIGDIEHDDSFSHDANKGYEKLGVPPKDKSLIKTVTKPDVEIPKIPINFDNIPPLSFRIYSHNVKNGGHDVLVPGEELWDARLRKITNSIKFNSISNTIVALQEVYKFQMLDIMADLNRFSPPEDPEWSYYGKGRIDGEELGEFVPILFKNSEWEMVFEDTIWLNDKNVRMSLEGWDAKYLRILSYATLRHKQTTNHINIFNTHLDHVGELSRIGSAELITEKMTTINQWPSFLCGDLNNEPKGAPYEMLTSHLVDTAKRVSPFRRYGHVKSTVTGFEGEVLSQGGQNIDYIFGPKYTKGITQKAKCSQATKTSEDPADRVFLQLQGFGLLHSKFNGVYMSDHRPLVADFSLAPMCS